MKTVFLTAILLLLAGNARAVLPEYQDAEIVARANGFDTYNLPVPAYLNSTSPVISDDGDVAFKLLSVYERGNQAMWLQPTRALNGMVIYEAPENKYVDDGQFDSQGRLTFSVFDEFSSEGIFLYDPQGGAVKKALPSDGLGLVYFSDSLALGENLIFRGTTPQNERGFYFYDGQARHLRPVLSEGQTQWGITFSYLFVPTVSASGSWAFKARLGEKGDWAEAAADRILLLQPEADTYRLRTVAADRDSDPASPYDSFGNVVSLSQNGKYVVFVARSEGKKLIVRETAGGQVTVAEEGRDGLSEIEAFNPKVNNLGVTVFRAKDLRGLRGIYIADETGLRRLVGETDQLIADLGKSTIYVKPNFPGLAGDVDINNRNEIVFSCVLKSGYEEELWGSAVFRLRPR